MPDHAELKLRLLRSERRMKFDADMAAAEKLVQLQRVTDKLAVEEKEKSDREAKIKKDDPPLVIVHSATANAPPPPTPLDQENAMIAQGNKDGARAMIVQRIGESTATKEETKLLKDLCTAQKDKACLKLLAKYKP